MMPGDNIEQAREKAVKFEEHPVSHAWDPERRLGELYARTLGLGSTAWDVYLLYPPGVAWDGEQPPHPAFWMHQLPAASAANRELVLYPSRFCQELLALLGDKVGSHHAGRADLGLQLHGKGLMNLLSDRSQYTFEDIQQAVASSRREKE